MTKSTPAAGPSPGQPADRLSGLSTRPLLETREQWHAMDYVRLLSKRRWTAIPAFVAVVASVSFVTFTATPVFEARSQLLIEAETQNIVTKEAAEQSMATVEYYMTQYKILQSRALARATIDKLKLWQHKELAPAPEGPEPVGVGGLMARVLRMGEGLVLTVFGPQRADAIDDAPKTSEAAGADETKDQLLVIQAFLDHLTITPVRNTRLVDVKFRSTDPKLAASVANALAQAYIDRLLQFKLTTSKEAADWLANLLQDQKTAVENSERQAQQYREKRGSLSTEDAQVVQKITDLNGLVTRAKTDRLQKELLLKQLEDAQDDRTTLMSFGVIASHPAIQRLNNEVSDLVRQETQMARDFGDRWPELIKLRSTLKAARSKLDVEVDNVVRQVQSDVANAKAQEDGFVAALEAQRREALARNREAIGYQALEREAESNRQIFDTLLQRAKETNISSQMRPNNIRIADEADAPTAPVWPNRGRNLLFALLGGLGLAVALAFTSEYLDNKLKSPEEIQQELGLRCLGLVPKLADTEVMPPLVSHDVAPSFAEAFRAVRTNVLFSMEESAPASDGRGQTLLITSTGPGEGKTLVATNVAVALAMAGQRVLLIDADMRRPRVADVFGLAQEPGLSDLLTGAARPSAAIRTKVLPGLCVLPAGSLPSNPAELLSSQRFQDLLAAMMRHFDIAIIDSPPIMAVIDASVIAHIAQGVLFVVAAEKTSRPAAMKALEQLDAAKANFLGAVLNRVDLKRNAFFYSAYVRREYAAYYAARPPADTTQESADGPLSVQQ